MDRGKHGTAPQSTHRYPTAAIRRGYAISALGSAASLALAFAGHENFVVSVMCVTIFLLFVAYGARMALRGASVIVLDQDELRVVGPRVHQIFWSELTDVRLRYYATRRDGENGWMELAVLGRDKRITLDSDIERFGHVAARCREAAQARGIELTPATLRNFEAALAGTFKGGRLTTREGAPPMGPNP